MTARGACRFATARACLAEARALYADHGDRAQRAWCERWLGTVERSAGNTARARVLLERSLSVMRTLDRPAWIRVTFCKWNLGNVACDEGKYAEARQWFREVVARARGMERPSWFGATLLACARWAARTGEPARAARLLAAATALREAVHHRWVPVDRIDLDEVLARLSAALAPDVLKALSDEGRRMSGEEALTSALEALEAWGLAATPGTEAEGTRSALTSPSR